jgi:hypothetical protein
MDGVQVAFILAFTIAGAIAGGIGALYAVGPVPPPVAVFVLVSGGYVAAQAAMFAGCMICWGAETAWNIARHRRRRARLPRARVIIRR